MAALESKEDKSIYHNSTVFQCELPLCCDSVEWCNYKPFESLIAVGHYELVTENVKEQTKIGGITLFEYEEQNKKMNQLLFKETAAILDLKWHSFTPSDSSAYVSTATTIGTIGLYALQAKPKLNLTLKHELQIPESPTCLCLDWCANLCVTGLSNGCICVMQFDENKATIVSTIKGHSDSVWSSCFDRYNSNVIYSGADDCVFAAWDHRDKSHTHKDDTTHQMGVCSIANSYKDAHLLFTGSYDEYLRVWDKRKWQKPIDSIQFKDGVWRIKCCPNDECTADRLVIATMRDHFNIIQFKENSLQTLHSYTLHYDAHRQKSNEDLDILCYGCDWSTSHRIATCSFYDKQFHCWTYTQ